MTKLLKNESGFTLVELLIVVAIIAVLATVAAPRFLDVQDASNQNICAGNRASLESALEQYAALDASHAYPASGVQTDLVDDGYLKRAVTCPDAGTYSWDANGVVSCTEH